MIVLVGRKVLGKISVSHGNSLKPEEGGRGSNYTLYSNVSFQVASNTAGSGLNIGTEHGNCL